MFTDGKVVNRQKTIAIEHVKSVPEFRQRLDERAAGAEEFGAIERVLDVDAPFGTVAVKLDDFLAKITDAKNDAREASFFEEANLMGEKWFTCDLDEELWDFFRDWTQASGESAGEQGDGKLNGGRDGHGWVKV
jgi:hypothetical protein